MKMRNKGDSIWIPTNWLLVVLLLRPFRAAPVLCLLTPFQAPTVFSMVRKMSSYLGLGFLPDFTSFFDLFPDFCQPICLTPICPFRLLALDQLNIGFTGLCSRQLLLKPMKKSSLGVICVFAKDGPEILTRNTDIKWHAGWFSISMEFWESIFLVRSFQLIRPTVQQKLLVMLKNSCVLVCLYRISNSILAFWHICWANTEV